VFDIRVKLTARGLLDWVLSFTTNVTNEPFSLRESINVIFILSCGHEVKDATACYMRETKVRKVPEELRLHAFLPRTICYRYFFRKSVSSGPAST
jgi:hypothetical protein